MNKQRLTLDTTASRAVCAYAIEHAILPDDAIRLATRLRPREPFLTDSSELTPSRRHGQRYLNGNDEPYWM